MAKATAKKARSKDKIDRRTGVLDAIELGIAAVEQGERKQAHSIFEQTAELHPNRSEIWVWLGSTSTNLEDAESAFEKAYTIDPDNEQASLGLRWVRLRRKTSLADIIDATVAVPSTPTESASVDAEHASQAGTAPVSSADALAPATATTGCPNCGTANATSEKFCVQCGQDLSAAITPDVQPSAAQEGSKQGFSGRTIIFALVAIIAVAIALSAFMYFSNPF